MPARVIVLAGPSGAGKSRLAERLGLPVLHLDDFYRSGGDPALPVIAAGPNAGEVDWDHPDSWLIEEAVATICALCRDGVDEVPIYALAQNGRCGTRTLDLHGAPVFVAEGLFAQDVVAACTDAGLLAAAYCVRQHPALTFWRRLSRDLRERRKPPLLLLRRGWALAHTQQAVVADAVAKGCRAVGPDEAYARLRADFGPPGATGTDPVPEHPWRQPDGRSCGAAVAVRARMLTDPTYDARVRGASGDEGGTAGFAAEVLATHGRLAAPRDAVGRPQMPWPRALGTAPWALARLLTATVASEGFRYRVRLARTARQRRRVWSAVRDALAGPDPLPSALYVGSRRLPRHVLLATAAEGADAVEVYDPATGATRRLAHADFGSGRLRHGGWRTPWFVVVPGSRATPPASRTR